MSKPLSEILTIRSEFNFFKAAAHLDPFDLHRLESLIDDLLYHTAKVREIFAFIDTLDSATLDVEWISEGKNKFYEINRNVESIDSIVLQALNLLEANLDEEKMPETTVFDKLDTLSEASLEIKKSHLIPLKTKIDVSVEYNDIYNLTMNSINTELENCLKKCFKIHEKRFSSPVRHAPAFSLEILTKKLLQQRTQLRLPLLNEIDNELYREYLDLKHVVDPLKASLNFIPLRIEDFRKRYAMTNVVDSQKMEDKYEALVKEMNYLQNEVNDLKYELVDKRWSEIFSYLNTEMSFLITNVEKEVSKMGGLDDNSVFKSQVFKRLKYTTDIVENTFIVINQAIDENLLDVRVMEKSNELADAWLQVKEKLPEGYIDMINDETNAAPAEDLTSNFKKLSLDQATTRKASDDKTTGQTEHDKRKSRYGQFLFNKMNLKTVIIESDPTSVRKPEELQHNRILTDSGKHNQLDATPSKSKDPSVLTDVRKIPDLKSSLSNRTSGASVRLSGSSTISHHTSNSALSARSSPERTSEKFMSEEFESPVSTKKEVHEETLNQLLNGSPDVFQTPAPKRHVSDPSVMSQSKIPVYQSYKKPRTPENFKSKIPRPTSRVSMDRPSSRLSTQRSERPASRSSMAPMRSVSSLGTRSVQRATTSLALSRATRTEIGPSRIGLSHRHSMIPQTPVRATSSTSSSRRKSMIPQPTPIKELIERSGSRLSAERGASRLGYERGSTERSMSILDIERGSVDRSASRMNSGRISSRGSRSNSSLGERIGAPPPRPVWR
ncbi:CYFA0S15e02124g1_1 [Cyberlindnera fabianii]|uniref:CYFA0S15e02124g1_1 n=1 Tax=Cyberlindnera fabianii TaxID=36022 RepID=A0A061B4K5_CYBFA|nr:CYFA0S15e02124g1_1 [Cyberlindnera fabianii]